MDNLPREIHNQSMWDMTSNDSLSQQCLVPAQADATPLLSSANNALPQISSPTIERFISAATSDELNNFNIEDGIFEYGLFSSSLDGNSDGPHDLMPLNDVSPVLPKDVSLQNSMDSSYPMSITSSSIVQVLSSNDDAEASFQYSGVESSSPPTILTIDAPQTEAPKKAPRRRRKAIPKSKLYEKVEPCSDSEEEKKRLNARKAKKNRDKQKEIMKELLDKNTLLERDVTDYKARILHLEQVISSLQQTDKARKKKLLGIQQQINDIVNL